MSANWPCVSHKSSSAKIGESEGDKDGGFVRNAEGTLWLETYLDDSMEYTCGEYSISV